VKLIFLVYLINDVCGLYYGPHTLLIEKKINITLKSEMNQLFWHIFLK